jgi:hypothetical protein
MAGSRTSTSRRTLRRCKQLPNVGSKKWWQSKAVWGGIVAVVGAIGDMFTKGGPTPENLMALAGALIAIYGRLVATTAIE